MVRLFAGIQDHTVVEVLDTGATLDELEAAALLLANQDEALVDAGSPTPVVVSRIVEILTREQGSAEQDREP